MPYIKFLELIFHFPEAMQHLSLNPHSTKTILTIHEKDINRTPLAQLSKDTSGTLTPTTPHPLFPQTSPGSTPTRSFSMLLLPVELKKRNPQITTNKISYSLIKPQLLHCTSSCAYKFHTLAAHLHPKLTQFNRRHIRSPIQPLW